MGEIRQLLQRRIEPKGEVFKIVNALNDLYRQYDNFNRLCIEWNPGYERAGWFELVGYRDETEKEIEAHNKVKQNKKKSEFRYIKKKEAELKKIQKTLRKSMENKWTYQH